MLSLFLVNTLIVVIAVLIQFEVLYFTKKYISKLISKNVRVICFMFVFLFIHVTIIWFFAICFELYIIYNHSSHLLGNLQHNFFDLVYLSLTAYTSLGFGDIYPKGDIRFLVVIEPLLGALLIAWNASFLFQETLRKEVLVHKVNTNKIRKSKKWIGK
tara:strand:- start:6219 stop:6692 length:474 start_codon:yes stop_codon:yes gene_type:complete